MTRLVLLLVLLAPALQAQNSVLGVRGLGFPGRWSSALSRGVAGADQLTDPLSAINPGAVVLFPAATAGITISGGYRDYDLGTAAVDGLRETRFPVIVAGGRLSQRFGFGVALSTYAERTWDLTVTDTVMVRGTPVEVTDRLRSLGSIANMTGALAYRPIPQIGIGVGLHAITGSTRLDARRTFADSAFREYRQSAVTTHSGFGVGLGAVVIPVPDIRIGLAFRKDGTLATDVDGVVQTDVSLPTMFAVGINAIAMPGLRLAAAAIRRTWSSTAPVFASDTDTRDTWEFSGGLGLDGAVGPPLPLRFGVRYAQLPYVPAGQPTARELDVAAGTSFRFGAGRGVVDLAVERVLRDGGGVQERVWQITMGMTVRP
ncbi:MAG: hypothetical protein WD934_02160 [Gemmatimonadales bacterium]